MRSARTASRSLGLLTDAAKADLLRGIADAIDANVTAIVAANTEDVAVVEPTV